jgi:hypothetical protein
MAQLPNGRFEESSPFAKELGIVVDTLPDIPLPQPTRAAPSRRPTLSDNPASVAASISYYRRSLTDSQFDKYELPSVTGSTARALSRPGSPTKSGGGRPRTPLDASSPGRINSRPQRQKGTSSLFDSVFKPLTFATALAMDEYPSAEAFDAPAPAPPSPRHRRNKSSTGSTASSASNNSRFTSWLRPRSGTTASAAAPPPPSPTTASADGAEDDALLALDPSAALLAAASADPLDPASFHALHAAAAALVARLHAGYAAQATELAAARRAEAERAAETERAAEADARAAARLARERDEARARLAEREEELAEERRRAALVAQQREDCDSGFESASECGGASPVLGPVGAGKAGRDEAAGTGAGWSEVEALRARVRELEEAVDDAMGLMSALGI